MKKILTLMMLAHVVLAHSQKQANIWYFGYNAGLDFNSGAPVSIIDSQLFTNEGSAVMSDADGHLLFYTDGSTVYNKVHSIMQNGTGLHGGTSSSQSALIVPKPGSQTIYYIFTVPTEGAGGLNYTEVNMQSAGGLGAITSNKNITLLPRTTEQLTAIRHSNGNDIWVTVHGFDTGNSGTFYSFLVTAEGVSMVPVSSTVGTVLQFDIQFDGIGCMKIAPNGKKIAMANKESGSQICDFDAATGKISNAVTLVPPFFSPMYGVEFSPSGNMLYMTGFGFLLQYDVTAPDIMASEALISQGIQGTLQLAPDGKIYCPILNESSLIAINNPETPGTGCNLQNFAVDLQGMNSYYGLPSFIQSFFLAEIQAENFCLGEATSFSVTPNPTSVQWNFGDGQASTELAPQHTYAAAGTYTVTAIAVQNGRTTNYQKIITITAPPQFSLGGPFITCDAGTILLTALPSNFVATEATYEWSFDGTAIGENTMHLQATDFGTYQVTVTINGCSHTESVAVTENTTPVTMLIDGACEENIYTLKSQVVNNSFDISTATYSWSGPDGFTAATAVITPPVKGEYTLTVTTPESCTGTSLFTVTHLACLEGIQKGISPNGDTLNDSFDLSDTGIQKLTIFNRYGESVYSYSNYTNQWKGQTDTGKELPTGTYYYVIQHEEGNKTGWVYINREQ
jgi:gliding motility-associated-like protein